jgi:ribose transport system permease protein
MSSDDHTAPESPVPTADTQSATSGSPETGAVAPRVATRVRLSAASLPILLATIALFVVCGITQPDSIHHSALFGMLPLAGVLAILAMGQTLVIQQGGIDLSVPGMVSLTLVMVTHIPSNDPGKMGLSIVLAFAATFAAGLVTGFVVSYLRVTAIVATLGMNAVLYGFVLQISGSNTTSAPEALSTFAGGKFIGIPNAVCIAIVLALVCTLIIKRTIFGRRFEAVGSGMLGARAAGLEARRYQMGAYGAAALLYCAGGVLLAGIINTPNLFEGDSYLLPTVAAVVLGGTSLLGGRGSVIATAIAALFISQLDQYVIVLGANNGVQNLVDAGALGAGLAIYSVPWGRLRSGWQRRSENRADRTGPGVGLDGHVTRGAPVAPGSHK